MAAGRIDVSRGRYVEGFDRFRRNSRFVGVKRGLGDRAKGGSRVSSGVGSLDFRRNEFSCRDEVWLGDGAIDSEIRMVDDEVQLPLGKKRKFSPITWNEEDTRSKVSSKISVAKKAAFVSLPTRARVQGSIRNLDRGVTKGALPEIGVAVVEVEPDTSLMVHVSLDTLDPLYSASPLLLENDEMGEVEHGQDKVEEFDRAPNIYTSRWASDSDSPRDTLLDDDNDLPRAGFDREASPEEGEVQVEDLSESGSRSRGSGERSLSVGSSGRDVDSESELPHGLLQDVEEFEDGIVHVKKNQSEDDPGLFQESRDAPARSVNMRECCRSVCDYEQLNEISEGTYGKVYRARDTKTGEIVALKKVKMNIGRNRDLEEYGFPLTALREINLLMSLYHPSIVNVKEVVMGNLDSVFMVMECMDHDLKGLMQAMKQPFSTSEVKCLMLQLLAGVKYLHDNWVLHRDLKTSNLLLNNNGELKICDFGMSRQYGSPLKPYTSLVVTLWYRAPELLLGTKEYSTAIDMWSVGCIMAELLAKEPLFSGKSEIDQLDKIFRTLGTPNVKIWPALSTLPGSKTSFVQRPYNLLRKKFPATSFTGSPVLSDLGFDLLNKLLTYDPEKRITADDALDHPWFHEVPLPRAKELMPTFPPQSEKSRSSLWHKVLTISLSFSIKDCK